MGQCSKTSTKACGSKYMQNISETSHPGNKQNSLCPWEASTGCKNLVLSRGYGRQKCQGKVNGPSTCQQLSTRSCNMNPWQPLLPGSGHMVGHITAQTGTCSLLQDTISRSLIQEQLHGTVIHVSQWLWLSLKPKTQNRNVVLPTMYNTAYSIGLASYGHFLIT